MPKPRGQQQSQKNQQLRRSKRFNHSNQKSTTADDQGENQSSSSRGEITDVEMKGETPTKRPDDKKTCLAYEERCMEHKWPESLPDHDERPERIQRIYEKLTKEGLVERCIRVKSRMATIEEVALIHDAAYVREFESTQDMDADELLQWQQQWDSIDYACPRTWDAALWACGNLLECVDAVVNGRAMNGAAVIRPPGHHAEPNGAYGFCFINNVAVAAKYAQTMWGVGKILILDWDVHHGNGIQSAFYTDPTVLYISLHRYDRGRFFPSKNGNQRDKNQYNYTDVGEGDGRGFNINIPWDGKGIGDGEYLEAFEKVILPISNEFEPELVLVSAGFDAARDDPLGGYRVTPHGYARMTQMLSTLANGRIVLALEGGYSLTSTSISMAACVRVLLGEHPVEPDEEPKPCSTAAKNKLVKIVSVLGEFWKCVVLDDKTVESHTKRRAGAEFSNLLKGPTNTLEKVVGGRTAIGKALKAERRNERKNRPDEGRMVEDGWGARIGEDSRRDLEAEAEVNGRGTEEEAEEVQKSRTDGKKKKAQNESAVASDTNVVEAGVVGRLFQWTKKRKSDNAATDVEDWKRRKSELRALDERISKVEMRYAALRDEEDRRVADNEKIVAKVRDDNDAVEAAYSKVADVRSKLAYLRKERVRAVEEEYAAVEKCVRDKVLDSLLEGLDD